MDIKLIALDIDGTLTNHAGIISERNRLAVRRAIDAGIHVVLATGRGRIATRPVWRFLELHGPSINYGGAMIADIDTERALVLHEIPPEVIHEVLEFSRQMQVPAQIYLDETVISSSESEAANGYTNRHKFTFVVDPEIGKHTYHNVPKILAFAPVGGENELFAMYRERFAGIAQVSRSSPGFIEINRLEITKATALSELGSMLNIRQDQIAAVGDNFLDLEMLQWAGLGVSVADAAPEVLSIADLIVPPCGEDGVAVFIEDHVLC
ncbi:MAG TPA: Cof-type HAD-IIB family hydrolase [Clostridia bacterium]|nr:Cof-type HAD-IIB family hydrolase [Clostridia bacterium]